MTQVSYIGDGSINYYYYLNQLRDKFGGSIYAWRYEALIYANIGDIKKFLRRNFRGVVKHFEFEKK